ncbi:hypothetical protein SESBI_14189 [Sesbania bispinosa]|nr:hypothetical protein SESBI_14189 [Sesbania bispinosa]
MSSKRNLQTVYVPLLSNKPVEENVQVNDLEVNEVHANENQTKVPVSVLNYEMSSEGMDDIDMENDENGETELEVDSDYSEDSMKGVQFDDNEEERSIGANDWFRMPEMGQVETDLNENVMNMKVKHGCNVMSHVKKNLGGNKDYDNAQRKFSNVGETSGVVGRDVANINNMEEEYESEEFDSDVDNIIRIMKQKPSMKGTTRKTYARVLSGNWVMPSNNTHLLWEYSAELRRMGWIETSEVEMASWF